MRDTIRTKAKASGAARAIGYCLGLLCASLVLPSMIACSAGEFESSPSNTAADSAMTENPQAYENREQTPTPAVEKTAAPVVVFLGTSLTAGYGLPDSQAFPALIRTRIDASGLEYRVVNAGVSGDTSAGGLRRLGWLLRLPIAALVLELGANDMLRGHSISALRSNLEAIIERTSRAYPDARILVAGMRAAPNLGHEYVSEFDAIYPALASKYNASLVPFLLQDVAADRQLNQADGIHPTAEGHALIAERIWKQLKPILRSLSAPASDSLRISDEAR